MSRDRGRRVGREQRAAPKAPKEPEKQRSGLQCALFRSFWRSAPDQDLIAGNVVQVMGALRAFVMSEVSESEFSGCACSEGL